MAVMKTIDKTRLTENERTAIETAAEVLKKRYPVSSVLLFGSRARGEGNAESDLDLLVLTTRTLDWRERRELVDSLFEIQLDNDVVLSPLIVDRKAWQSGLYAMLRIHAEVERDGVAV